MISRIDGALIKGKYAACSSTETVPVINPSDGSALYDLPSCGQEEVDLAVQAARDSFEAGHWCDLGASEKKKVLHRFAELVEENAATLDLLDAEEMGKPLALDICTGRQAADFLRFYAESVDKVYGKLFPGDSKSTAYEQLVPRGVVGAIIPWNVPTFSTIVKMGPALAAGNSVVLKPSEHCSRSAFMISRLALEAGLPEGVVSCVPGLGKSVGAALAMHEDVDMISFTGSSAVGKQVQELSGRSNMKVVLAECGGKSPHLVFNDCPSLAFVADGIVKLIASNQGQLCVAGSRLLVQKDVQQELLQMIVERFDALKVGAASDRDTTFGPLVSAEQRDKVLAYVDAGLQDGCELAYGGNALLEETGGSFCSPTVFTAVPPEARIFQEEIFGPVLAVSTFESVEEAIALANGTAFGLGAYAWSSSLAVIHRLIAGVKTGIVINSSDRVGEGAGLAASYEGYKYSGIGAEGGLPGMKSYLRRKLVVINH